MKKSINDIRRFSNSTFVTIFSLWFFGELVFNILPIAVILTINLAFGESFEKLLLLPDWSFASVVLFGGSLSLFIELKTKLQRDSSHKVFTGTRTFTIGLIASVISLTLALLREKGIGIADAFLANLQLGLFAISALSLLMPIAFRVNFLDTYRLPAETANIYDLVSFLSFSLDEAEKNIRHAAITINKNVVAFGQKYESSIVGGNVEFDFKELESQISRLERNLALIKSEWKEVLQTKKLASEASPSIETIHSIENAP